MAAVNRANEATSKAIPAYAIAACGPTEPSTLPTTPNTATRVLTATVTAANATIPAEPCVASCEIAITSTPIPAAAAPTPTPIKAIFFANDEAPDAALGASEPTFDELSAVFSKPSDAALPDELNGFSFCSNPPSFEVTPPAKQVIFFRPLPIALKTVIAGAIRLENRAITPSPMKAATIPFN